MSSQPRVNAEEFFLSGLKQYLLGQPGVSDVSLKYGDPVGHTQIKSWEHAHNLILPDDVTQFYLSHDGLSLYWQYTYNKKSTTIGRLVINSLKELNVLSFSEATDHRTPSLQDASTSEGWSPLSVGSHFVVLSYCSSCGHIGLAYNGDEFAGIWLIDLGLNCHYLSATYSDYLCLAQVHLGLIQWPYAVANIGLSPDIEIWFEIFIPHRLLMDYSNSDDDQSDNKFDFVFTKPNFGKLSNKLTHVKSH